MVLYLKTIDEQYWRHISFGLINRSAIAFDELRGLHSNIKIQYNFKTDIPTHDRFFNTKSSIPKLKFQTSLERPSL